MKPMDSEREEHRPRAAGSVLTGLSLWLSARPRVREWLICMSIGVAIEIVLHVGQAQGHWRWLVNLHHWATDTMVRLVAEFEGNDIRPPKPGHGVPLALVEIDDVTWRGQAWGGEPQHPPARLLAQLVGAAFAAGARDVVLDVLVEDGINAPNCSSGDSASASCDFAEHLRRTLAETHLPDQRLVLMRSLRYPLRDTASDRAAGTPADYLPELRRGSKVDAFVGGSQGKASLAAPYFIEDADRVTRSWQLFRVVCERGENGGDLRIVPSVQLAVSARHCGVSDSAVNSLSKELCPKLEPRCTPFPLGDVVGEGSAVLRDTRPALERQVASAEACYWSGVTNEWNDPRIASASGCSPLKALPRDDLGSLIAFRFSDETRPLGVSVVRAGELLESGAEPRMRLLLAGRTVVIGQTYEEAQDVHHTPLGRMHGAMVLVNAIDSMTRHQFIQPPAPWVGISLTLAVIALIAYLFVSLSAVAASAVATLLVLALWPLGYFAFRTGIWLDFALPLVGIQVHRLYDELKHHWVASGGKHGAA